MLQKRTHAGWSQLFASSRTEADVVRVANDYLATWLPSDFEVLPAECRITSLSGADELANAAVTFTRFELQVAPDTSAQFVLGALSEVFIAAQLRLRQLRSPLFDPAAA